MANKATDEKNLVLKNDQAELQQIMDEFGSGALDSLTAQDVVMPRFRLIQNTSRVGTPGKWTSNTDTESELDELNIIVLDISNYRVMFPEPGKGDKPLCRSNDGYTKSDPSGAGDSNCDNCRFSVWSKDPQSGKSIKPKCSSGYTLLGIILLPDGSSVPGMVSLKGSAIRPLKQFFTRMKQRNLPSFAYITNIKSMSETNDLGRFYKPVFEFGEDLNMASIKDAAIQARAFKQYISKDILADVYEGESSNGHNKSTGSQGFLNDLEDNSFDVVGDDEVPF